MTIKNETIKAYLRNMAVTIGDETRVPLQGGLRLQCLPSVESLITAQKHQCAAFISDVDMLIVWDADPAEVLARAQNFQRMMIQTIFTEEEFKEPKVSIRNETPTTIEEREVDSNSSDEIEDATEPKRPTVLINAVVVGLTLLLLVTALGAGWRVLVLQTLVDGKFLRFALLITLPVTVFLSLVCIASLFPSE